MQGWIEGFQESIDFMEQHLTDELDIEEIAGKAALSPFYYQRIFGALCGMTVGEYIRARRMTLAAQDLNRAGAKVIDVALGYGYDSPDSFAKAFQRFHGITPSQAREPGAPRRLRSRSGIHRRASAGRRSTGSCRNTGACPCAMAAPRTGAANPPLFRSPPRSWRLRSRP